MKKVTLLLLTAILLNSSFTSCSKDENDMSNTTDTEDNRTTPNPAGAKIAIAVGGRTFNATLANNATANAFRSRLPMTLNMPDLNRNEKFFDLPQSLPSNASNPGLVVNGDIMLYGSNTLVLFYKNFSTSYNYTRIGRLDNPTELEAALGAGNVTVTFTAIP